MVFPSEYEGFGLAPLESMACGTPVLCATGGALQETSGDGVQFFDYDKHVLAEKIVGMLDNERLREELTQRGIKQASKFSWEKTAVDTAALYRTMA